jgi:hypothetical protein
LQQIYQHLEMAEESTRLQRYLIALAKQNVPSGHLQGEG